MKELKDQLSNLIENNKIDQAIKILKEESAKRDGALDHLVISLSSRYKRYKEKSLMGLEARDQEFTKIVSDTLEIVQYLDNPIDIPKPEPEYSASSKSYSSHSKPSSSSAGGQSSKYIQMGIGGLAVIGLIALIGIFMGGDDAASGTDTTYDDTNDDANAAYEDTYTGLSTAGDQGGYEVYDVSGQWSQVSQSFGADYDCSGCYLSISQDGNSISMSSEFWSGDFSFNNQDGYFEGYISWGEFSNEGPAQSTAYMDENYNLIIGTAIQGYQGTMTYSSSH